MRHITIEQYVTYSVLCIMLISNCISPDFRVWDVEKRELLLTTRLDLPAMSCAVSPDSSQVAVGLKYGTVVILNAK